MRKIISILVFMLIFFVMLNSIKFCKAEPFNEGFVKTNGINFEINNKTFYFGGTNNYYINYKSKKMIDDLFQNAVSMNIKVIRTWGFLDVGEMVGNCQFNNNVDNIGQKDGIFYQYFDKSLNKPIVNESENGVQQLDYILYKARQCGIKIILPLVNNWSDFGGMQQYCRWINSYNHDDFYTNEILKNWYKNYANTLIQRTNRYTGIKYKDDTTIFAWELANEPRCTSDTSGNTLLNWIREMSIFIKTLDSNHMVCVGDEGFFNYSYDDAQKYNTQNHWTYHGCNGVDANRIMDVPTIDFGTFHLYTADWGTDDKWGDKWIIDHANLAKEKNKPMLFEEFGLKDKNIRSQVYERWLNLSTSNNLGGFLFWMLSGKQDDGSLYPDYDGYTLYTYNSPNNASEIIYKYATMLIQK